MTELHYHQWNHSGQLLDGSLRVVGPGNSRGLARIGQQHIDVFQQIFQAPAPLILRIVIGIERDSQPGRFQPAKQFADIGPQPLLQIERGKMEVARVRKVVEVEIFQRKFSDRPGVGQHVPPAGALQNDSEPGRGLALNPPDPRDIDSALRQAIERNLAERVFADQRLKPHPASQRRQIVGHDGGRTAERKQHAVGQQLPLRRKFVWQAVEDQVEVQFSGDGNVKTGHVSGHYRRCGLRRPLTERAARELRGFTLLVMVDAS